MTGNGILQILLYLALLLLFIKPLGWYIAQVFEKNPCGFDRLLGPIERFIYKVCGIHSEVEMNWKIYLASMLVFNFLGFLLLYCILRLQFLLPLNPQGFVGVPPLLAFNTAVSFMTNTNWQAYAGETTLSYLTQMIGLTAQNFMSAATGLALLAAFIRGLVRHETTNLGNFWVDMVRSILYILLPLSLVFALVLSSQGVIQNFKPYVHANVTEETTQQVIPMGPVASQVAIKQLGTNGGGFFNANSAHPFENPTPLSNFLEMLAILLIPAALCFTYGKMIQDPGQGWIILIAMLCIFVPQVFAGVYVEQQGNPQIAQLGINQAAVPDLSPGGNMEGKETRFGIVDSSLWTSATTASANGSTNSMLDSFTPLGGMIALWFIQLGEVTFGGIGTGLSGMLIFIILTVFVAGLMVGRTPEYLGKKIEPYEMKMASFIALLMPMIVLILTSIASVTAEGKQSLGNPGAHGFTEILYAFSSMTNNNGSAFAGLNVNTPFYNLLGGIAMLIGRFWIAIPILAIAGSLVRKKIVPSSLGTLPTKSSLFIILLVGDVILLGALTFLPTLALGPIVEHLILWGHNGN